MCSTVSLHSTFCTIFPLLPFNTCFLSPRSHISITPSCFSLLHSLSSGTPEFPLSYTSHTPCCPLVLACPCFCPFHSYLHSSIFLLFSIFPLLHWHIRSSGTTSISLLLLLVLFFSLQHSVSILHSSLPSKNSKTK
jgi:hypothetical protein